MEGQSEGHVTPASYDNRHLEFPVGNSVATLHPSFSRSADGLVLTEMPLAIGLAVTYRIGDRTMDYEVFGATWL